MSQSYNVTLTGSSGYASYALSGMTISSQSFGTTNAWGGLSTGSFTSHPFTTGWTTFDIETKTDKLTRENKELEEKMDNLTKDIGSLRRIIES